MNIVLLAALAVSAVRLLIGAPMLRERLAWGSIAAAATYAAANWLYLIATMGSEAFDGPLANLLRALVIGAGVVGLSTVAPTLRRQRAADRERAEAEERFRRTMDSSTEPMSLVGPDGRYRYANPASQALFRYSPAEIVGRHYSEFLVDATEVGANLQRALTSPFGRAAVQRRIRRRDGSEVIVEVELIGLGDGNVLFVGHDVTDRVELAERLERERQRLRLAQEISHIGSGEIDLVSGQRWWSDEMFRLFGFEPVAQPPAYDVIWARVHPDDRAIARATTEHVMQGIGHAPFTFRLVLPDGSTRHLLQHSEIAHDADGVAVRATRVVADITTLQAAQAGLERERQRLRLAQEVSLVGSGETNLLTGERWWSAEMYELFGMEPSDEPPPFEVARLRVHPDDRAITEQSTRDVLEGREHAPVTCRIVLPDGRIRHLMMHAHLERTDTGEPAVMTRVAVDITQLQELQAHLERERIRLRYAQEISNVGSGEWNLQTNTVWWSDEMFRLLGFEPGSMTPTRDLFLARIHVEDRPKHQDAVARLIAGASAAPQVLRIALPDGTTRSALCQLQLERDEHGVPHLITGVLADVTGFLALQEQLGQAKRLEAIGTLTAGIAHDFNNILTVIGGSIELAQMGDPQRLAQADQAVQRATALIRQLLQFSRSRATGAVDESVTLADLRTIAREAAEALAEDPVGPVRLDVPRQAVLATVDPTRVHRVLMNLLVNARDAVQEAMAAAQEPYRPEIGVGVRLTEATPARPAGAEIEVRDNGGGIPPEVRDRIFEPFFTTKPVGRGTGLGLATVYGIVRDMGGAIDLASQPGQGTTFRIWLPLMPPATDAPRLPSDTPRILVVDDQADLREFAVEALAPAGYRVTTAGTSDEALSLLQQADFDLAVVDAFVDDTPLPSLLVQIRQSHPELRVLVCSGAASGAQAIAWGADEYLAKPFTAEALTRSVRGILGIAEERETSPTPVA